MTQTGVGAGLRACPAEDGHIDDLAFALIDRADPKEGAPTERCPYRRADIVT